MPVEAFQALKDALLTLGVPARDMTKSDDVTAEFVDVQARIKNLRQEEETLNRLMKEKAADVKDVVEIRKQIQPVRQDIDRAEARLNYLNTFAALSTVELTLREIKDYKPPTAPTFGDRIGRTFGDSWDGLVRFGEGFVLFVVALTPWLPLLVPGGVVFVWLVRRLTREGKPRRVAAIGVRPAMAEPVEPKGGEPGA